jgi:tRNA-splicing ligase RtcB
MKPHEVISSWKGDKRFGEMARRAAALKKAGQSAEQIVAAITAEFGPPPHLATLRDAPRPFRVYGEVGTDIEPGAVAQLELAMRLPVAERGALAPDAHVGYALPIGGVVGLVGAISPMFVGVDIGCRMAASVFACEPEEFLRHRTPLFADLKAVTTFGAGAERKIRADHEVLEDERWSLTNQSRGLRVKAAAQLGTSGAGNHFAELVVGERLGADPTLPERFCALVTHSGSRGVGYAIANHYARLAVQETARRAKVPKQYEWLNLDSEAGQEYFALMELAGAFAKANHDTIHAAFARRSGLAPLQHIENFHNFAWIEDGLVVHRKGATPAGKGVLGIIPGSMATNSYIVAGNGNPESLQSASHGAGRRFSRTEARNSISMAEVKRFLAERDVLAEGVAIDEAPQAYKDVERVIELQVAAGLITPIARMRPIAVIMAGEKGQD